MSEKQAMTPAERDALIRQTMMYLAIDAGGHTIVPGELLNRTPKGFLTLMWELNQLKIRYLPSELAQPIDDPVELALGVLVHASGGEAAIPSRYLDNLSNGTLICHLGVDAAFEYRDSTEPIYN